MADNLENKSPNSDVMSAETSANPQNKKLLIIIGALAVLVVGLLVAVCILAFGGKDSDGGQNSETPDSGTQNEDEKNDNEITITVKDGYLTINDVKTEHKVHTEPVISVIDGYVAINGVKTEYEVNKADVITVEDGYVVVNGEKTEHKVHTEPVISIIDGYVAINGVKTEYEVELSCNHEWQTETIAPTCTEGGYDIKTCSVCEKRVKTNETPAKSHNFGSYVTNNEYHWMECTACDEEKDKAMHTPNDDGECEVCGIPLSDTPGIVYDVSADGTYAKVIGYKGIATKVKIASEYYGLPVKSIYDSAFKNNSNITSVIIPDSVTSIGSYAFYNCWSLSSVVIGDSVTSIGSSAFNNCGISSIVIPDSVTSIGSFAFYNCGISSIVIPDSVTSIGSSAFSGCTSLSSVVIGDSVTSIGSDAFYGCKSLSSVVIGDSVTSIGFSAFQDCTSLTSVYIADIAAWCNISFYNLISHPMYYGDNLYLNDELVTELIIPDSVTSIGSYAFYNCTSLSSVVIPDSVTSIGSSAFSGCTSLSSVVIGDSVTSIGSSAFYDCDSLSSIVIPDSVTSIGRMAFYDCTSLRDVYYTGSAEEWAAISIASNNYRLTSATIHYNYIPE